MVSLEQAKELVQLLEGGLQEDADLLVKRIYESEKDSIYKEIGELTRDLHDSIKQFHIDERMNEIAKDEIPDARNRLNYVIQKTEVAANRTMDAVDRCMPIADSLHETLLRVRPKWNSLMRGQIELSEFKALCHRVDGLLTQVEGDSSELRGQFTEILMAQDFQDLTGQIISRVISLVSEVEHRLVDILTAFGSEPMELAAQQTVSANVYARPEGPIINPQERADAVASQDEVDDLLSSLGF